MRADVDPRYRKAQVPEHQVLLSGEETAGMIGRSVAQFHVVRKKDPSFPKPVRAMPNAHPQWIRSEVLAWILALPRVADGDVDEAPRNVWGNPVHTSATERS